jgi:hypothetical protein
MGKYWIYTNVHRGPQGRGELLDVGMTEVELD